MPQFFRKEEEKAREKTENTAQKDKKTEKTHKNGRKQ